MRAGRLLSLLMLLQTRGLLTAAELAVELQVTERTIYRDITALCTAGVPIYTTLGPGGGYGLLEDYRINLTGLNPDEVRALFMLSIPAPLDQLGVGQELRAALLKLTAALPDQHRHEEVRSRQRIHLDLSWWFHEEEQVPYLPVIQQAVWSDHRLHIQLQSMFGTVLDWVVAPYGLVAKASVWYLVYGREEFIRAERVSWLTHAEILADTFRRPGNFDLEDFWKGWVVEFQKTRPEYMVKVRVAADLLPHLNNVAGDVGEDGWAVVSMQFESFESARSQILAYGRACEVLEPLALRMSVADYARQIVGMYG